MNHVAQMTYHLLLFFFNLFCLGIYKFPYCLKIYKLSIILATVSFLPYAATRSPLELPSYIYCLLPCMFPELMRSLFKHTVTSF